MKKDKSSDIISKIKNYKKCCQSDIHFDKGRLCIQKLKPFKCSINLHEFSFNETDFTKEIISNRIEKNDGLGTLEMDQRNLADSRITLNRIRSLFKQ